MTSALAGAISNQNFSGGGPSLQNRSNRVLNASPLNEI
jgi:hypothetical protein